MALFHTTVVDNQIKALDTIGNVSGAICTFDTDRAERLVSCVCEVESGNSEINIVATGKNLTTIFTDGKVPSISTGELVNASGGRSDFVPVLPNTDYTFSISSSAQNLYIFYYDSNHGFLSYDGGNTQALTGTTPNNCAYIMLRTAINASSITDAQFEKGSSASTYEPFGTNINIPFGETLSGNGSFDVLSGILTRSDDTTKQLSANYIQTNNGINNVYCDTGDIIDLKFVLSVGKAIS